MTDLGPAYWADSGGTPALSSGFYLDGTLIEGARILPLVDLQAAVGPTVLAMMAGNHVTQQIGLGGKAPLDSRALRFPVEMHVASEADYWLVREVEVKALPVLCWFEVPLVIAWDVAGAPTTQTEWKTDRETPWGIAGISQATHPPRAFDGSTELTVKTTSPSAGEIQIPDAGGYGTWTTGDQAGDLNGRHLTVRYHPQFRVVINDISSWRLDAHNSLVFRANLQEIFTRADYS